MSRLVIYVPFPANRGSNLEWNAEELRTSHLPDFTRVVVVYKDEEGVRGNQVQAGDVLIVHAHGATTDTNAYDNTPTDRGLSRSQLISRLQTLRAPEASKCYFAICHSALEGHIADYWKTKYGARQWIYGRQGQMHGGLIRRTRTRVWSSILDPTNSQLTRL